MQPARIVRVLVVLGVAVLALTAWRAHGGAGEALRDAPLAPVAPTGGAAVLSGVDGPLGADRGAAREALPGQPAAPPQTMASASTSDTPPAIRGVVVDELGAPLEGATVSAEHDVWSGAENWTDEPLSAEAFVTTHTGDDGRFELPLPVSTLATVRASHAGRAPTVVRGVVPGAELRLVLTDAATLEGDVLDAHDRTPIPNALVRVLHGEDLDEVTWVSANNVGRFRVEGLMGGTVGVTAAPESHVASRMLEVELSAGATVRVEVLVETGRAVTGVVRDAVTLAAIAGARVSAWDFYGKTVTTDEQGRFRLDGIGPFPDSLAADAPGYGRAEVKFVAGDPADEPLELEIALTRALRLTGRIVDTGSAPIPGAVVVANGRRYVDGVDRREWREAVADEDGRFVIDGARHDVALAVQVRAAGYGARSFAAPAPDTDGVVALGDLVLAPQATLGGQVVDHLGAPVAHAYIGLGRAGALDSGFDVTRRTSSTDRAGRFFFVGLDAGVMAVGVSVPDGRVASREVTLREGEHVADLVLELPGGETLRGRVIDGKSRLGLADACVVLTRGSGSAYERRTARSDEAGEFELVAVSAGEWAVYATLDLDDDAAAPLYGSLRRKGVVADGTYLELPLARLDATLHGRVLDARDVPVAQCYVTRLVDGEPAQDSGTLTDADGRFTLRVPSGAPVELAAYATATLQGDVDMTVLDYHMRRRVLLDAGPVARGTAAADAREATLRSVPE